MSRAATAAMALAVSVGLTSVAAVNAAEIGHGGPIRDIDLAGGHIASAGFDYSVIFWRSDDLTPLARHIAHAAPVSAVMVDPTSETVWSSDQAGLILAWSPKGRTAPDQIDQRIGAITDIRRSPDGRLIAAAGWDGRALLYDAATKQAVHDFDAGTPLTSVRFAERQGSIVAADIAGSLHVWSLDPREAGHQVIEGDGLPIAHIEMLADGDSLLSVSSLGELSIWSLQDSERLVTVDAHDGAATALAISPAGDMAATADVGGTIIIWRISGQTPERVIEVESGPVWALAFDQNGEQLLSGGDDGTLRRWDVATGAAIAIRGTVAALPPAQPNDRGAKLFNACRACHSVTQDDENKSGPTFHGLFGRRAGTVPGYPYSQTLASSEIIWTDATLGALFRDGPENYIPGSRMPLQRMANTDDRAALIAHIKHLTSAPN